MKNKIYLFFILTTSFSLNCSLYQPTNMKGKTVSGKIIDGETGEVFIGQYLSEYNWNSNGTYTDTLGNFKLKFLGNHPFIRLTGYYEPIYLEVTPSVFNSITIDGKTSKCSKRILKKVTRYRKKQATISLNGTWEVTTINTFVHPKKKYPNESDLDSTGRNLQKRLPYDLKEKDLIFFDQKENLIVVNNKITYRFNKDKYYLSIDHSDAISIYRYEFREHDTLLLRKGVSTGETEWVIERK